MNSTSKSCLLSFVLAFGILVGGFSGVACHSDGDCSEQTCDQYGGSASRKLTSCFSSGSGSTKDEFVLKDESDNDFYTCSREADDNNSCGVALISAKEAYCKNNAGPTTGSSTSSSSGSTTSSSGSTTSSSGSTTSSSGSTTSSSGSTTSSSGSTTSSSGSTATKDAGSSGGGDG